MKPPHISFLALALGAMPFIGVGQEATGLVENAPVISPGLPNMDLSKRLSSPAEEIRKLSNSGVSQDIIKSYIDNSQLPFSLTPDNIIQLQQSGFPPALTTEMLNHDGALRQNGLGGPQPPLQMGQSGVQPPPPVGYGVSQPAYDAGAPPLPQDYYDSDLAQYGAWQFGPEVGWYWSPYDWAWGYPYPWGLGVFGYGRWWNYPGHGWIWRPGAGFHGHWTGWGRHGYVGSRGYGGYHGYGGSHSYGGYSGHYGSTGFHAYSANHGSFRGAVGGGFHGGAAGPVHGGGVGGGHVTGHSGGFGGGHGGSGHR